MHRERMRDLVYYLEHIFIGDIFLPKRKGYEIACLGL